MRFLCTPSETPAAYPPAHVRYTAHLLRTNWLPSGYAKGCQSDSWTSVIVSLTGSGQPGSHRKANVVSHHMIDHSGLITRRIGAKVRHRPFSRQGQLTVLYESQVVFARRIVTGSKLHRHHLPGLRPHCVSGRETFCYSDCRKILILIDEMVSPHFTSAKKSAMVWKVINQWEETKYEQK